MFRARPGGLCQTCRHGDPRSWRSGMSLGPFALISLFYVILGVRLIYQLARNFRQTFDRNFTHQDRMLVDQAAFFVLLPIAVALHELGHAIMIQLYGGEVLDWGFYGFAGYVAFDPRDFTDAQQIVIAAAGTAVNLLLAGIAVALVFLKRPPFRAAINQTLREAATRVASGWSSPVEAAIQRGRNGSALVLSWGTGAVRRSVMAVAPETGGIEFSGALRSGGGSPEQRPLGRDPGERDVDRLTMMLRLAMEAVEGWTPSSVVGRESEVGSERRLQGDGQ